MAKVILTKTKDYKLVDSEYYAVKYSEIKTLMRINFFKYLRYRPQDYDCDDFAFCTYSLARYFFGTVALGVAFVEYKNGNRHALNFVVTPSKEIIYIEPQTGQIVTETFKTYWMLI